MSEEEEHAKLFIDEDIPPEKKVAAYSELIKCLKLYHFDSKEHGGHSEYQSPATILLKKLGKI